MNKLAVLPLALFAVLIASGQSEKRMRKKVPGIQKPECSQGAICFSGEVSQTKEFRKTLNTEMGFVLQPGRGIAIVPRQPEGDCQEFAWVVNGPYREHRDLAIDTSYGWTAEQEVATSPREFRFVTNCADYRTEYGRLLIVLGSTPVPQQKYDEAMAGLRTLAQGKGRLWITNSRISHSDDTAEQRLGKIQWMKFSVEILLPGNQ
jgi:hypothetical protein